MTQLKSIREKLGMTQQQVADIVGVKVRQYQHIEKGTRRPSYDVLCRLEDLFQMPHRELLAQTGEIEE